MSNEDQKIDSLGYCRREKIKIGSLYAALGAFTVFAFICATIIGYKYILVGSLALYSYILGLQHAVDADHIAAIDNTTRKLVQQNKKPITVGMWFSLGHSVTVLCLTVGLVIAAKTIIGGIPGFEAGGNLWGTGLSGLFLFLIGLLNLFIVRDVYKTFKQCKAGLITNEQLNKNLNEQTVTGRVAGKLFKMISAPWQIFPIGILFGLGFDTATQVALIAATVGVSASVPMWTIVVLPCLFTAGMVTVDSSDGIVMRSAYGWAFMKPIRKVFYNLTITVISVLVAFVIGGIEMVQVLGSELNQTGPLWSILQNLDFGKIGYVVVGTFLSAWVVAILYYRYKGYEKIGYRSEAAPLYDCDSVSGSAPATKAEKTADSTQRNAGKSSKTSENAGQNSSI